MKECKVIGLLLALVICGFNVNAQVVGDYRTISDGNWSDIAIWERYNGAWVPATVVDGYPGQNASPTTVNIRSSHDVVIDVSPANAIGTTNINANAVTATVSMNDGVVFNTTTLQFGQPTADNNTQTFSVNDATLNCATILMANPANTTRFTRIIIDSGTVNVTGTISIQGAVNENVITVTGNGIINVGNTISSSNVAFTPGIGKVNYNSTIATVVRNLTYYNLEISGSDIKTLAGAVTINNNLVISSSATTLEIANRNITVNGTTTISGQLNDNNDNNTNLFVGKVTLDATGVFNTSAVVTAGRLSFRGGIENNNVNAGSFIAGIADFNTNSQVISGSGPIVFNNAVTITGAIVDTNRNTGGVTITGALNGTVAGSSKWYNDNNSVLFYGNAAVPMVTGVFDVDQTGNTVNYSRNNTQTIAGVNHYHLSLSGGAGTKTLSSAITVLGNLSVGAGTTLADGGFLAQLNGNALMDGAHTGAGRIELTGGAAAHSLSGAGSFTNLELDDANGAVLTSNITVNGTLTLTNGNIILDANSLAIGASGSIAGAPSATAMIVTNGTGQVTKTFNTGDTPLFSYPVGDTTGTDEYSPVSFDFSVNAAGGAVGVRVIDTKHPDNAEPDNFISRYWKITAPTLTTYTYSGSYTYLAADVTGTQEDYFKAQKWNGVAWSSDASSHANSGTHILSTTNQTEALSPLNSVDYTAYVSSVYYRSRITGNWSTPSTWEVSPVADFSSGVSTATIAPDATNSEAITILNTHTVTLTAGVIADQLIIDAGGTLNISTFNLTVENAGGIDLLVNGSLTANGGQVIANGAGVAIDINGTLNTYDQDGFFIDANTTISTANSPLVTLGSNSTINYTGAAGQRVDARADYANLSVSAAGQKDAQGNISVARDLAITTGTFNDQGNTITVNGNIANAGVHSGTGKIVLSGGTALHTLSAAGTYGNLTLSDVQGAVLTGSTTISGDLRITAGSFDITGITIQVNDSLIVDGTCVISNNTGTKTFNDIVINGTGTVTNSGNEDVTINGNLFNNGTFTAGTGNYIFAGALKEISGSAAVSVVTATVNGSLTNNSTGSFAVTNSLAGAGSFTNGDNATLYIGNGNTVTTFVVNNSGNTVIYNRNASQSVRTGTYHHLELQGGAGIKTPSGVITINGNLTIGAGTTFQLANRTTTVTGTTSIYGTLDDNTAGQVNTFTDTVLIYSTGVWTSTGNSAFTLRKGIVNNGTMTATGTGTYTFSAGSTAQILSGSNPITFGGNVVIGAGVSITNSNSDGVSGITVTGTLNGGDAASTFINQGYLTYLNAARPMLTGVLDGSFAGNTVFYNLAGAQDIKGATYHHLTLSSAAAKTLQGNVTVNGTFTTTGTVSISCGTNNLTLNGPVSHGSTGTLITGADTVRYGFNGAQTIIPSAYGGVLMLSGNGNKSLLAATTVTGNIFVSANAYFDLSAFQLVTSGNININNTATLDVNAGAELQMANTRTLTNAGTLRVVGAPGTPAVVTRNGGAGGYSIVQSDAAAAMYVRHYQISYPLNGITISAGSLDNTNNFSDGAFSNGSGSYYLNLTGLDLSANTDSVYNVVFGAGPTYNVERTSGANAIYFADASGTLAGENFDNDDANPGTKIFWTNPSSTYYSNPLGTFRAGLVTNWTRRPDGSGANPPNMTDGLSTFIIQNTHTMIVDAANGNISVLDMYVGQGTSGGLVIGDDATQRTVTVNGNLFIRGGGSVTAGSAGAPSHILAVYGNIENDGSITLAGASNANLELYGTGKKLNGTGNYTLNHISFKAGSSVTAYRPLNIDGNVTIENNATFADGGLNHTVAGTWSETGTAQRTGSGTITFDGTINTIVNNNGTVDFNHVVFSGGIVGSIQDVTNIAGNLMITNNTQVTAGDKLISIFGDFTVDPGAKYSQISDTTRFAGTATQSINLNGTTSFNGIIFANGGAAAKTVNGNISAAGIVSIESGATVNGSGSHFISGGLKVDGTCNWSGLISLLGGNLYTSNAANSFTLGTARLTINGAVTLTYVAPATAAVCNVANNVQVISGNFYLNPNTSLISSVDSSFSLASGTTLWVYGTDNFPSGFNTYNLDLNSRVEYDYAANQTVRGGITYGFLELNDNGAGGVYTKTADGNIDVNGDIEVEGGVNFNLQSFTLSLAANLVNNNNSTISGNGILLLNADDADQLVEAAGTGSYSFDSIIITQNATAPHTKSFENTSTISITGGFIINNPGGDATNELSVNLNNNVIAGTPVDFYLDNYCTLLTDHPTIGASMFDNFSGTRTCNLNSTFYYSSGGAQSIADGFTYGNISFNAGNKTAEGALDINGNARAVNAAVFYDAGFNHTVAGNWLFRNTNYTAVSATGTITFDGTNQSIQSPAGYPNYFRNLVIANTGTVSTSGDITILGNLTINNDANLTVVSQNVNIAGNWNNGGTGIFSQSSGITTFNGSANQSITANASNVFGNLYINKPNPAGSQTVTANSDISVNFDLRLYNDAGVFDITNRILTVGDDFYVGSNVVEVGQTLITTGSTVRFNGSDNQQSIGNVNANNLVFNDVVFSGSVDKQLGYSGTANTFVFLGDVTINGCIVAANGGFNYFGIDFAGINLNVAGDWNNTGTFQHNGTVTFNGGNQSILGPAFNNVVFAGTDTKTLQDGINANGSVTIGAGVTLDANNTDITLRVNWDNSAAGGVYIPGTGRVIIEGNGASIISTGTITGPQPGKSFYSLEINKNNNGTDVQLDGDLNITNDFVHSMGNFHTNLFELWIAGNFTNTGTFDHDVGTIITFNAAGGTTKNFSPGGMTFRGVDFNAPGATYIVQSNFTAGGGIDFVITDGYIDLNGKIMTVANNPMRVRLNGGTLDVDAGATIEFANTNDSLLINGGTLRLVGSSGNKATLTRTGGNNYIVKMTAGTLHAQYYKVELCDGFIITGGTIDAINNLSNGVFTAGEGNAYLTLNGYNFADFSVTNTIFNANAVTYNVARTTGTGTITFIDASGSLAGEQFDQDNANPGTLINWSYPGGFYWDGEAGTDQWDDALNWSSNAVPDSTNNVYLDHTFVTVTYTVSVDSSDAYTNRLYITPSGGNPITMQLREGKDLYCYDYLNIGTGATLTVTDNTNLIYVRGAWSNAGTFNPGNSTVIFDSKQNTTFTIASGGTGAGRHFYNFTINSDSADYEISGATDFDGNFTVSRGSLSLATPANDILVAGNWLVNTSGGAVFTHADADVTFDGNDQSISGGTFYNLLTATGGTKTLNSSIDIDNTMTIGAGTTFNAQTYDLSVGNDWYNNGTFTQSGTGMVSFDGTVQQDVDRGTALTTFNHLSFGNTGNKTFYNSSNVTGDLTISGTGDVDVSTFQISGIGTNNFLLGGTTLFIRGANNFPDNFGTYNLATNSIVDYNADIDQTVKSCSGWSYGNLTLTDATAGINSTKTAEAGTIDVATNVTISNVRTAFVMGANSTNMNLYGTIVQPTGGIQIDWGTGTSTLTHLGSGDWNIDPDITVFNNLVLSGTGNKWVQTNLNISGNLTVRTPVYLRMYDNNNNANYNTITCTGIGKTFLLEPGTRLYCPVAAVAGAAMPLNFTTYNLSPTSTVYLNSPDAVNQTLYTGNGIVYGNLYFRNNKTVTSDGVANLNIDGSFDMEDATYVDNSRNISVAGDFAYINNYTPSASTISITLDGNINQRLFDNTATTLNLGTVYFNGSGIKTFGDGNDAITVSGSLNIANNVQVSSNRNISMTGNTWDNDGIFYHYGNTVTFNSANPQDINPGRDTLENRFYNIAFTGAGAKTFNTYGARIYNNMTLNAGSTVNLGTLNYYLRNDLINTAGGTLNSSGADITFNGNAITQDINSPAFAADSITIDSFACTVQMYSDWTIASDLVIRQTSTLNTTAANDYDITISGNWENYGTFTANQNIVTFNAPAGTRSILSGNSTFYDVVFSPSAGNRYVLLSPNTEFSRSMSLGVNDTLDLNAQSLILGSPIGAGKVFTIDGVLDVDANADLIFNNETSQSVMNVSGTLVVVGSNAVNIATITRETAGVAGNESAINILAGGTLAARYYLIEHLRDAGLVMQAGSVLDPTNNLSDGTWSNLRNAAGVCYLNIEAGYTGDTIRNICFNYNGTPVQGTHFNVRRNTPALSDIVFKDVSGNLGSYLYEDDDEVLAAAATGNLQWPGVTETNWLGGVSSDWFNPANWSDGVPDAYKDAIIPSRPFSPVLDNGNATCKKLKITTGSLALQNGFDLVTTSDVSIGSIVENGVLLVQSSNSTITCGGQWTEGASGIFVHGSSSVEFNSGVGAVTITPRSSFNNVIVNNSASIFTWVGSSITFEGNLIIQNGRFVPGTPGYVYRIRGDFDNQGSYDSTVAGWAIFDGAGDQNITNSKFYNLQIRGSGTKAMHDFNSVFGTAGIYSNLKAETGATIYFVGSDTIYAGGSFDDGNETHYCKGQSWYGLGTYIGNGRIIFNRTAGFQEIVAGNFWDVDIQCIGQQFRLSGNITVDHDMIIRSGVTNAYLYNRQITNSLGAGTFTLEPSVILYVNGTNNFPAGFSDYSIASNSTVRYYGTGDQTIAGDIVYGNLQLYYSRIKTLAGDITIQGSLTINNSTLDVSANNYSITIAGNWNNNLIATPGSFNARQGEVIFNGTAAQNINLINTAPNSFYNFTVDKSSGTLTLPNFFNLVIGNNCILQNGVFDVQSVNPDFKVITIGGNLSCVNGTFTTNGWTKHVFNKASGTATISTNGTMFHQIDISSAGNAVFDLQDALSHTGTFTVISGTFDCNGYTHNVGNGAADALIVQNGTYRVGPNGRLAMADGASVSVEAAGRIEVVGTGGNAATVTRQNIGRYSFIVNGTMAARYALFEYMTSGAIAVLGSVDNTDNFSYCTFTNGANTGSLLKIESTQSFTDPNYIIGTSFPVNPGGGAFNVAKSSAVSGTLEFYDATGVFAGEAFDNDDLGLIIWTGPITLTWDGSKDTNWFDTANWTASIGAPFIPTGAENVIIPNTINKPVIDSFGAKTNNLTIQGLGRLTIRSPFDNDSIDLQVLGDITIAGSLIMSSVNDNLAVAGTWNRSGTTTLNGNVIFNGNGGTEVINNGGYSFYNLTISGTSTYQLGASTTIRNDFTIDTGSILNASGTPYNLTVGGDWINDGDFIANNNTVTFNASAGSPTIRGGSSAFGFITINAPGITYSISDSLAMSRNLNIAAGTLDLNGKIFRAGDNAGTDFHTISGTLEVDANAQLRMGTNSGLTVASGGIFKIVGGSVATPAIMTNQGSGNYSITVDGGTIWARFYSIEYIDASGVNLYANATVHNTNNFSDGIFSNGEATGTYLQFANEFGGDDTIRNITFNAGPLYNVTRTTGTDVVTIVDASGALGLYNFENDILAPNANTGLILWSQINTLTWTGAVDTNWHDAGNWLPMIVPDITKFVIIPNVANDPVIFNNTASAKKVTLNSGGSLKITRDLTIEQDMYYSGSVVASGSPVITVGDNWNSASGTFVASQSRVVLTAGAGIKTITPGTSAFYDLDIQAGAGASYRLAANTTVSHNLRIISGNLNSNTRDMIIGGGWFNTGTFTAGTRTVTFNGASGTHDINAGASAFYYLTLNSGNGTGNATFRFANNTTVTNRFTLTRGTADLSPDGGITSYNLNIGNRYNQTGGTFLARAGNITVVENWSITGSGIFTCGTSTVYMTSTSGTRSISPRTSPFYNLTINGAATFRLSTHTDVNNNLTINTGILDVSTGPSYNLYVGGDWTNNATFNCRTGTVFFDGNGAQLLTKSSAEVFYRIQKSGTGTLTLGNEVQVNDRITMVSGNISTGANKIVLGTGVASIGTLTYTSGVIIGRFERWLNATATNYLFPLGTATSNNSFTIRFVAGLTNGSLIGQFVAADPGNSGLPIVESGLDLVYQFTEGYWNMTAANGLACTNYNVTATANGFSSYFINSDTRLLKRDNGGSWAPAQGTHVDAVNPYIYRNTLSGISNTMGSQFAAIYADCYGGTIAASQFICSGSDVSIFTNTASPRGGSGAFTYQWQYSKSATAVPGDASWVNIPSSNFLAIDYDTLNTTTKFIRRTSDVGCVSDKYSNELTVTVYPMPSAAINPDDPTICSGGSLLLDGNPSGGSGVFINHLWTGSGVDSLDNPNIQTPTFNSANMGSFELRYRVTDNNNCIARDTITVTVNTGLTLNFTVLPANDTICDGSAGSLRVDILTGTLPFSFTYNDGTSNYTLNNINSDPYDFSPSAPPVWIAGVYTSYTYNIVTISDANGCTNAAIAGPTIRVMKRPVTGPQYYVPNPFQK